MVRIGKKIAAAMLAGVFSLTALGYTPANAETTGDVTIKPSPGEWETFQAQNAKHDGTLVKDGIYADEASMRECVLIERGGYVEFTVSGYEQGNAPDCRVSLRYSLSKNAYGTARLLINGKNMDNFALVSDYMYHNLPDKAGIGGVFDEVHTVLFGVKIKNGDKIRLVCDGKFYVDRIEVEPITPYAPPKNALSVLDYGAKPDDNKSDSTAIQKAVNAAKGKIMYIPKGKYIIDEKIVVGDVKIVGDGMWYSSLEATRQSGGGSSVFYVESGNVEITGLGLRGKETQRGEKDDTRVGINGRFGSDVTIKNVLITHFRVGVWVGADEWQSPKNVTLAGLNIRNIAADGINFSNGTSNSTVENCYISTTGDDGFGVNPEVEHTRNNANSTGNIIRNSIVELVYFGSGINLLGGSTKVEKNIITDVSSFANAGINLYCDDTSESKRHPFTGVTTFNGNELYRSGGNGYKDDWASIAIRQHTPEDGSAVPKGLTGKVTFIDNKINDAPYAGIRIDTNVNDNLTFIGNEINRGNGQKLEFGNKASGTVKFEKSAAMSWQDKQGCVIDGLDNENKPPISPGVYETKIEGIEGITWLRERDANGKYDEYWFGYDFTGRPMTFDVPEGVKINGGRTELVRVSGDALKPVGESGDNFEARHGTKVRCSGKVVIANVQE